MFTLTTLLSLLVSLVVIGLIVWVLLWALGAIGIPEPFNKIARVLIILFAAVYLISLLIPFTHLK